MEGLFVGLARQSMPGKDENKVDNQEPTNQENEPSEEKEEAPERYEDRVIDAITGVMGSDEE